MLTKEEQQAIEVLYAKAKKVKTLAELVLFTKEQRDRPHDYNSCVEAVGSVMVAAGYLMAHELGLSGAQAGFVNWRILEYWGSIKAPASIRQYKDMLYPQNQDKFEKTITKSTWKWLQDEAALELANSDSMASNTVYEHWKSIAEGKVPFGYTVVEN